MAPVNSVQDFSFELTSKLEDIVGQSDLSFE